MRNCYLPCLTPLISAGAEGSAERRGCARFHSIHAKMLTMKINPSRERHNVAMPPESDPYRG
jgi:hypothetical protein